MCKGDAPVQTKNPVREGTEIRFRSSGKEIDHCGGISGIEPECGRGMSKVKKERGGAEPDRKQRGNGKQSEGKAVSDSGRGPLSGLRLGVQHQKEQQSNGNKLRIEIQKAVQQQDREKHFPAETALPGAKRTPERPEKQSGRDPSYIQKKLKKLIMHMLDGVDPGLERTLQAAISCITEANWMPENHRNGIPGVEKPADKLRGGEGEGQKPSDAFTAAGEKGVKDTAEKRRNDDKQNAQTGFPGLFLE